MLVAVKDANLGLAFLLELCVYGAVAYWGATAPSAGRAGKALSAVGAVIGMAVLWSLFGAPSAAVGLRGAALVAFQAVWFAVGAGALVALARRRLALVFGALVVVNMVAAVGWGQLHG